MSRTRFAGRRCVFLLVVMAALFGVLTFGAEAVSADSGTLDVSVGAYWLPKGPHPPSSYAQCAPCTLRVVNSGGDSTYYSTNSTGYDIDGVVVLHYNVTYHIFLSYSYQYHGFLCTYSDQFEKPLTITLTGNANPGIQHIYLWGDSDDPQWGCPSYPEGGSGY
jgi:hypothetical protein